MTVRHATRRRESRSRKGLTLVEMLVVVALVVMMMAILASVFQKATEAMIAARSYQELDNDLRRVESVLRSDLEGVTARMTPPNDPAWKRGYFEYGENAPADLQGEDTDDYLAFTTRAARGHGFSGRVWIPRTPQNLAVNQAIQPVAVTSKTAEVIYFLRNGNLYRRVFLVAPERRGSLGVGTAVGTQGGYNAPFFGNAAVSWQGMNDLSCRPPEGINAVPIPNDLGDLTSRENRAFRPRFSGDYRVNNSRTSARPDGQPDDFNLDGLPDYYPTFYPNAFNPISPPGTIPPYKAAELLGRNPFGLSVFISHDTMPFPFVFPGAYSRPAPETLNSPYGWLHALDPSGKTHNHSPIDLGDTLPVPASSSQFQTWWGFPTWRETTSPRWLDPIARVNNGAQRQPQGLRPFPPQLAPSQSTVTNNLLPPQTPANLVDPRSAPAYSDGAGSATFARTLNGKPDPRAWEDDLLLANVRSFDVKSFDPDAAIYSAGGVPFASGYHDLGYGSLQPGLNGLVVLNQALLQGTPLAYHDADRNPIGFGHEGRIPPLSTDFRLNPSRPDGVVADDHPSVIRLRRVWDSWSTTYTNAPDTDLNLNGSALQPVNNRPVYPSFPPPYPSPLRGIQVQIRLTDPASRRIKVLTIRHDFADKL